MLQIKDLKDLEMFCASWIHREASLLKSCKALATSSYGDNSKHESDDTSGIEEGVERFWRKLCPKLR